MIFPVKMTEHILIAFVTGSECHDLHCILTQLIHHISDQVKSLLVCQTGYDSDHHGFRVLFQSQILLKLDLIFHFFLTEGCRIVCLGDIWVCFRVKFIVINTIYNTAQVIGTCTHQTVQTLSVERCLDFFCISAAYRCNCICKDNTAF